MPLLSIKTNLEISQDSALCEFVVEALGIASERIYIEFSDAARTM